MVVSITKFEFLPNELMIKCFKYFDGLEIFYAFNQLNSRFNLLIRIIPLYLNFQYNQNKFMFTYFCKQMELNPQIKKQIYSLYLFQENTFLSKFPLNEFIHLQSLTTIDIDSNIAKQIDSILVLLPKLQSFHFINPRDKSLPISIIPWNTSLKTLTIPTFSSYITYNSSISSLLHLTITFAYTFTLRAIFKHIPMLKYLNIQNFLSNKNFDDNILVDNYAIHLKQLIINHFECHFEDFENIAKQIPNLKNLILCNQSYSTDFIDAWRWENLITSLLPQLIIFKFEFIITYKYDILEKFRYFQSHFWINEHHWYTGSLVDKTKACIYTIPYIFNQYVLISRPIKYYEPLMNNINTFDNVTDLTISDTLLTLEYRIYFSYVKSLRLIHGLINDERYDDIPLKGEYVQCLRKIVNLSNLRHLFIESNSRFDFSSILLEILKRAPLLSSIIIPITNFTLWYSNYYLCKYLNQRIKTLCIHHKTYLPEFLTGKERERFCEIFRNIERLICFINNEDQLLFLLKHLTKLTYMQVVGFSFYDITDLSILFQKNLPELNISFITTTDSMNRNELRIWINRNISSQIYTKESVLLKRSDSPSSQISVLSFEELDSSSRQTSKFFGRFLCVCSSKRKYSSSTKLIPRVRIRKQRT